MIKRLMHKTKAAMGPVGLLAVLTVSLSFVVAACVEDLKDEGGSVPTAKPSSSPAPAQEVVGAPSPSVPPPGPPVYAPLPAGNTGDGSAPGAGGAGGMSAPSDAGMDGAGGAMGGAGGAMGGAGGAMGGAGGAMGGTGGAGSAMGD